jgi:hypothetical protein
MGLLIQFAGFVLLIVGLVYFTGKRSHFENQNPVQINSAYSSSYKN